MAKNFAFPDQAPQSKKQNTDQKSVGPMSKAIRETAATFKENGPSIEDAQKKAYDDARKYRQAEQNGTIISEIPTTQINDGEFARDRYDLQLEQSEGELSELKNSIRLNGQKLPIEVVRRSDDYQLLSGFRRLNAIRQLFHDTGEEKFSVIRAIVVSETSTLDALRSIATENIARKNPSFGELAHFAITSHTKHNIGSSIDEAVDAIFNSSGRQKVYHIRKTCRLLMELGDNFIAHSKLARNVVIGLIDQLDDIDAMNQIREELSKTQDSSEQIAILKRGKNETPQPKSQASKASKTERKSKAEFREGDTKVTARNGELRILDPSLNFVQYSQETLREAVRAFEDVLKASGN